jgi:ketosteroid isomerase-like protein
MSDNFNFKKALKLFERQIECIMSDDRRAQMELYAENLRYEFPFANDRPRLIEGRKAFRDIMVPLWEEARKRGVKVVGYTREFHATDEIGLFLAVFDLEVLVAGSTMSLPFVQLIRIKEDRIAEVREYFNPSGRQEAMNQR